MARGSTRDVVRQLTALCRGGVLGNLDDEQLLERFIELSDESAHEAFAAILRRHGPMVFGVCHRVLRDAQEAEDAFQATFLVLARKASSVVPRQKVANWLYGVAYRTASEARIRAARRRAREERVATSVRIESPEEVIHIELRAILDDELAALPARYRGPIVLCELEGLSRHEAAARLGVPEGTLSSQRLGEARGCEASSSHPAWPGDTGGRNLAGRDPRSERKRAQRSSDRINHTGCDACRGRHLGGRRYFDCGRLTY